MKKKKDECNIVLKVIGEHFRGPDHVESQLMTKYHTTTSQPALITKHGVSSYDRCSVRARHDEWRLRASTVQAKAAVVS